MKRAKGKTRGERPTRNPTTPRSGATSSEASDTAPARKPGAQPGNRNAWKHGATAADMNSKRAAKRARLDDFQATAERQVQDVLRVAGLQSDPLAALVARQVGRLEAMAARLEAFHGGRGYFTKAGDLKPSVNRFVDVVDRLLGEARRLLEQLQSMERPAEPVTVRIIRQHRLAGDPEPPEPEMGVPTSDRFAGNGAPLNDQPPTTGVPATRKRSRRGGECPI